MKLYKVKENFSLEEDFFSIEDFPLVENKIKFVEKEKSSVFLKFAGAPSGWGRGIIYLKNQNDIKNRAEVFIHLKDELYYFEGKF
ncbi:hypothetical protein [Treponema zioleckii]|uniref:hypothetical protein n=1 Tax=Treponema zioleckii TaxID=331680 RepID=UPI00168A5C46|nr:hypothetical protein [Treponema zioleckii]